MSVPNCRCGVVAVERITKKEGPNFGKPFYCCGKPYGDSSRCNFFQWNDAASSNSTPSINHTISPNIQPSPSRNSFGFAQSSANSFICPTHQVPLQKKQVRNEASVNVNRFFYVCPAQDKCVFKWAEELENSSTNSTSSTTTPQFNNQNGQQTMNRFLNRSSFGGNQAPSQFVNNQNEAIIELQVMADKESHPKVQLQKGLLHLKLPFFIPSLVLAFKKTQNAKPISQNELEWVFPLEQTKTIVDLLGSFRANVTIKTKNIPQTVFRMLSQYTPVDVEDDSGIDWNKLPQNLFHCLKPFQKQGIIFGLRREGRVMLGDEMGLGKTIQALSLAFFYKEEWPLLIICPSSLRYNWSKELERWLIPNILSQDIHVVLHKKEELTKPITIVSYDLARLMFDKIEEKKFKVVITDECHYLKNSKTQRAQSMTKVFHSADRCIFITGTPALNRPIELYNQFKMVVESEKDPTKTWFKKTEFQFRYCDARDTPYGLDDKGSSNLEELYYLLYRTVMIRRLKDDVLSELPAKMRQQIYVTISKKYTDQLKKGINDIVEDAKKAEQSNAIGYNVLQSKKNQKYLEMYKLTGLAKIEATCEIVEDLLENEIKFVLFAHHLQVMDEIEACVKKKKVNYIRIDGETTPMNRKKYVERFTTDENCRLAIMSITACGVGLTLTPCSFVVFAELAFTPGTLIQAEDRVHRLGQKQACTIRYILGKNTLDDRMWPMIKKKLDVVGKALDGAAQNADNWNNSIDYNEWMNNTQDEEEEGGLISDDSFYDQLQTSISEVPLEEGVESIVKHRSKFDGEEEYAFEKDSPALITQEPQQSSAQTQKEPSPTLGKRKKKNVIEDEEEESTVMQEKDVQSAIVVPASRRSQKKLTEADLSSLCYKKRNIDLPEMRPEVILATRVKYLKTVDGMTDEKIKAFLQTKGLIANDEKRSLSTLLKIKYVKPSEESKNEEEDVVMEEQEEVADKVAESVIASNNKAPILSSSSSTIPSTPKKNTKSKNLSKEDKPISNGKVSNSLTGKKRKAIVDSDEEEEALSEDESASSPKTPTTPIDFSKYMYRAKTPTTPKPTPPRPTLSRPIPSPAAKKFDFQLPNKKKVLLTAEDKDEFSIVNTTQHPIHTQQSSVIVPTLSSTQPTQQLKTQKDLNDSQTMQSQTLEPLATQHSSSSSSQQQLQETSPMPIYSQWDDNFIADLLD